MLLTTKWVTSPEYFYKNNKFKIQRSHGNGCGVEWLAADKLIKCFSYGAVDVMNGIMPVVPLAGLRGQGNRGELEDLAY